MSVSAQEVASHGDEHDGVGVNYPAFAEGSIS